MADKTRTKDQIQSDNEGIVFVVVAVVVFVLIIVTLPALFLGLGLRAWARRTWDSKERWMGIVFVAVLSVGYFFLMRLSIGQLATEIVDTIKASIKNGAWEQVIPLVFKAWLWTLPAAPVIAGLIEVLRPRGVAERHQQRQEQEVQRESRLSASAAKKAEAAPDQLGSELVIGKPIGMGGDLRSFMREEWAIFPAAVLKRGLCVIGFPGSGKTETLLRLASSAAKTHQWQIIFVDCKGEHETAIRFHALMKDVGYTKTRIFPVLSYDMWRGGADAIKDRLKSVLDFSEPYYESIADVILDLAIKAPQGPPTSSDDFLNRLRLSVLADMYQQYADKVAIIADIVPKDARGVYNRYYAFFSKMGDQLDGSWAFEDCDAAYFLIDGVSLQDQAIGLGRCLLQDFNNYAARRKAKDRQVLFIVDEYSAIERGTKIHDLIERLRSYGAATVVGSQSYGGLGEYADRILDATPTKIIHQCDDPERLTERAGERTKLNFTIHDQTSDDQTRANRGGQREGAQRSMSYREEREAKIDPDKVRQLQPGEAFIVSGGQALKVRVSRAEASAEAQAKAAYLFEHTVDLARQEREERRQQPATQRPPVTVEQPHPDEDDQATSGMVRI